MTIYQIIESIATIGSTLAKQAIVEKNKDNELLKKCFFYAENPRFNFWIKADPSLAKDSSGTCDITLDTFVQLDRIINREFTGNAARLHLQTILLPLDSEAREIVIRVVNHDLRCNACTAIANKVWRNLIPEYPVLLCGKMDAKAEKYLGQFENKDGFIVQLKSDGGRLIIKVSDSGTVSYHSRNGSTLELFNVFDSQFSKFPGYVFDGELIVKQPDGKPNRKVSNGFYTKAVRGTLSEAEAKNFSVQLWDMIPEVEYNSVGTVSYEERLSALTACNFTDNLDIVESKTVQTLAECMEFYSRMRAEGQEGAIIKVASAVWEDGRSKNYVKLKEIRDFDLLCVGVEEGTGKNVGKIGALILESSCGKLRTNCGTGLKDADRERDPSEYIGKIVEGVFNEVITSKGRESAALFLPVFKQVRFDKTVANSLEELV